MEDNEFLMHLHNYWFCVKHEIEVRKDNNCWQCVVDEANAKMDEAIRAKSQQENNPHTEKAGE